MTREQALQKLLAASKKFIDSLYREGECHSSSLGAFSDEVEEVVKGLSPSPICPHDNLIMTEEGEYFYSRTGCLDCGEWLEPVKPKRLK